MTFAKGDPARALALYEEAAALFRGVDHPELARVQGEMGWTALAAGYPDRAARCFREAVRTNEAVGSARGTGLALMGLAAVEAAAGRAERAVSIAAAARALSERAGIVVAHPLLPRDRRAHRRAQGDDPGGRARRLGGEGRGADARRRAGDGRQVGAVPSARFDLPSAGRCPGGPRWGFRSHARDGPRRRGRHVVVAVGRALGSASCWVRKASRWSGPCVSPVPTGRR